ncbi:hypothetical protein BDV93DRAFT_603570 [Ceratobasidium sp. AG-I]|nr:hypothetical protein BDV93DRAFT_603570 [Ceratobasidium sp. AG-I]
MSHDQALTDSESDGHELPKLNDPEEIKQISSLDSSGQPTSGPAFFELRRKQWRNAQPKEGTSASNPARDSTSHARLETVVTSPGYEYNDSVWNTYLKSVNERLKGGVTLRKPLPLWIVIRVLRAGWMRDGTWFGPGPVAPEPPISLETSSAMTETPAMTPTGFQDEPSMAGSQTAPAGGRVYAARRVRAPGWTDAALEVERIMQAVERGVE